MARIYLDYASLTPIDPRVIREMKKFSADKYANPSSLYKEGVAAKKALDEARGKVARLIHAHSDEIVFTSGGTEANGLALEGVGRAARRSGIEKPHLIISAIEHSSIMEVANMMEKHGCEVTRLAVDKSGVISLDELRKAIKPSTFLISIMTVNNEVGSVQPIVEIAKIVRTYKKRMVETSPSTLNPSPYPLIHTDAAQAALHYELNTEKLGVDLITLDGSKVYGPRGIGALFVRRRTPIEQIMYGGGQEGGLRSGTENLPAIVGFAKALEIAGSKRGREVVRLAELKSRFIQGLKEVNSVITVNGDGSGLGGGHSRNGRGWVASDHILNVSIPGIDNEFFVLQLDAKGIACSTKSSCLRDEDESYVLKSMGANSKNSVRFSFGRWTRSRDVKRALKIIKEILAK